MLRATVEKVDKSPVFYTILLEDPTPERGRPINTQMALSAAGIEVLRRAIVQAQEADSSTAPPQVGKRFMVMEGAGVRGGA